jgi:hypothetical protein
MRLFYFTLLMFCFLTKAYSNCGDSIVVSVSHLTFGFSNKVVQVYDSTGNVISYTNYQYNNGIWENNFNETYVRNAAGNILSEIQLRGNNQLWTDTFSQKYNFYNSHGDLDSTFYSPSGTGPYYDLYEYDSAFHLIDHSNYTWFNNFWNNTNRDEYFYNNSGDDTLQITFSGNGLVWDSTYRFIRIFDNGHNVIQMTKELYNGTTWVVDVSYNFVYTNGLLDSTFMSSGSNQSLTVTFYDSLNRDISTYNYQWDGNSWTISWQTDSTLYDTLGHILYHYDVNGVFGTTYDSLGNLIEAYRITGTSSSDHWQYYYSSGLLVREHTTSTSRSGDVSEGDIDFYYADVFGTSVSCNGNAITLTTDTCSSYSYQWSNGATTSSITVGQGTYSVTVTHPGGVSYSSPPFLISGVSATVANLNDTMVCINDSLVLDPGEFYSYFWNDGSSDSVHISFSSVPVTLNYFVTVSDSNACISTDSATVVFDPCNGTVELDKNEVKVYPVPAGTEVNLQMNAGGKKDILLFNGEGEVLKEFIFYENFFNLNVENLKAGYYILRVIDRNGIFNLPFVKI